MGKEGLQTKSQCKNMIGYRSDIDLILSKNPLDFVAGIIRQLITLPSVNIIVK